MPNAPTYPTNPIVYSPGNGDTEPVPETAFAGIRPIGYRSYANNVLAYDMNRPAGTAYYHKPRGSWRINQIYALYANGNKIVPYPTSLNVYVKFEVTEPLLLSPFLFGSGYGKQGLYGIPAMSFMMVMNGGSGNRAWRCVKPRAPVTKTVSVVSYED